jgi:Protein of unknown function (DUF3987)
LIAQHLAKYEKLFASLALALHLAECAATGRRGQVSERAALQAAAWCEYLEAHARRCYGLLADQSHINPVMASTAARQTPVIVPRRAGDRRAN